MIAKRCRRVLILLLIVTVLCSLRCLSLIHPASLAVLWKTSHRLYTQDASLMPVRRCWMPIQRSKPSTLSFSSTSKSLSNAQNKIKVCLRPNTSLYSSRGAIASALSDVEQLVEKSKEVFTAASVSIVTISSFNIWQKHLQQLCQQLSSLSNDDTDSKNVISHKRKTEEVFWRLYEALLTQLPLKELDLLLLSTFDRISLILLRTLYQLHSDRYFARIDRYSVEGVDVEVKSLRDFVDKLNDIHLTIIDNLANNNNNDKRYDNNNNNNNNQQQLRDPEQGQRLCLVFQRVFLHLQSLLDSGYDRSFDAQQQRINNYLAPLEARLQRRLPGYTMGAYRSKATQVQILALDLLLKKIDFRITNLSNVDESSVYNSSNDNKNDSNKSNNNYSNNSGIRRVYNYEAALLARFVSRIVREVVDLDSDPVLLKELHGHALQMLRCVLSGRLQPLLPSLTSSTSTSLRSALNNLQTLTNQIIGTINTDMNNNIYNNEKKNKGIQVLSVTDGHSTEEAVTEVYRSVSSSVSLVCHGVLSVHLTEAQRLSATRMLQVSQECVAALFVLWQVRETQRLLSLGYSNINVGEDGDDFYSDENNNSDNINNKDEDVGNNYSYGNSREDALTDSSKRLDAIERKHELQKQAEQASTSTVTTTTSASTSTGAIRDRQTPQVRWRRAAKRVSQLPLLLPRHLDCGKAVSCVSQSLLMLPGHRREDVSFAVTAEMKRLDALRSGGFTFLQHQLYSHFDTINNINKASSDNDVDNGNSVDSSGLRDVDILQLNDLYLRHTISTSHSDDDYDTGDIDSDNNDVNNHNNNSINTSTIVADKEVEKKAVSEKLAATLLLSEGLRDEAARKLRAMNLFNNFKEDLVALNRDTQFSTILKITLLDYLTAPILLLDRSTNQHASSTSTSDTSTSRASYVDYEMRLFDVLLHRLLAQTVLDSVLAAPDPISVSRHVLKDASLQSLLALLPRLSVTKNDKSNKNSDDSDSNENIANSNIVASVFGERLNRMEQAVSLLLLRHSETPFDSARHRGTLLRELVTQCLDAAVTQQQQLQNTYDNININDNRMVFGDSNSNTMTHVQDTVTNLQQLLCPSSNINSNANEEACLVTALGVSRGVAASIFRKVLAETFDSKVTSLLLDDFNLDLDNFNNNNDNSISDNVLDLQAMMGATLETQLLQLTAATNINYSNLNSYDTISERLSCDTVFKARQRVVLLSSQVAAKLLELMANEHRQGNSGRVSVLALRLFRLLRHPLLKHIYSVNNNSNSDNNNSNGSNNSNANSKYHFSVQAVLTLAAQTLRYGPQTVQQRFFQSQNIQNNVMSSPTDSREALRDRAALLAETVRAVDNVRSRYNNNNNNNSNYNSNINNNFYTNNNYNVGWGNSNSNLNNNSNQGGNNNVSYAQDQQVAAFFAQLQQILLQEYAKSALR